MSAPTVESFIPTFPDPGPNVPSGSFDFDTPTKDPKPTSTYNTVNLHTPTALLFGGANGGGGELYTGQTATFTFSIDVPDYNGIFTAGTFMLTMTANPEPASLALAGLAMVGGAFMAKRRRKAVQLA